MTEVEMKQLASAIELVMKRKRYNRQSNRILDHHEAR